MKWAEAEKLGKRRCCANTTKGRCRREATSGYFCSRHQKVGTILDAIHESGGTGNEEILLSEYF